MQENSIFAVIGLGEYGRSISETLAQRGYQVRAYDIDPRKTEAIKDEVALAVSLDCTDQDVLDSQGVAYCTTVIVAIGADFEATMLCCVNLKELNPKLRIIARASTPQQRMILNKLGITEILSPEKEVANAIAEKLINPNIINSLLLPDGYEIVEIRIPEGLVGKTVGEVDFLQYELNLITIKQHKDNQKEQMRIAGVPMTQMQLQENGTLLLFGTKKNIERFLILKQV